MDIQNFIAEFKKTFVYDILSQTLSDEQLFEHVVDGDAVLWFKEQTRQMWLMWEKAKSNAVPEGFILVKKVHPDAIVHNQGLGLFKECQVIYGWDGKSKDFKDALNKGFYHGVKLGAKAVLETAMIEAQESANADTNS